MARRIFSQSGKRTVVAYLRPNIAFRPERRLAAPCVTASLIKIKQSVGILFDDINAGISQRIKQIRKIVGMHISHSLSGLGPLCSLLFIEQKPIGNLNLYDYIVYSY